MTGVQTCALPISRLNSDRTGSTLTNQATWGNVALTATAGTITNAQTRVASVTNVYANGLLHTTRRTGEDRWRVAGAVLVSDRRLAENVGKLVQRHFTLVGPFHLAV